MKKFNLKFNLKYNLITYRSFGLTQPEIFENEINVFSRQIILILIFNLFFIVF